MIYAFRIHPLVRLFLVVVLCWVGVTCIQTRIDGMVANGILLILAAGMILRGILRQTFAYLRTW